MKRNLVILIMTLACLFARAQIVNIPDPNLKFILSTTLNKTQLIIHKDVVFNTEKLETEWKKPYLKLQKWIVFQRKI